MNDVEGMNTTKKQNQKVQLWMAKRLI